VWRRLLFVGLGWAGWAGLDWAGLGLGSGGSGWGGWAGPNGAKWSPLSPIGQQRAHSAKVQPTGVPFRPRYNTQVT